MISLPKKAVSPVIAIVLLLMMTVAAAGAAYFWLTSMQSSMQESSRKSIENIMEASGRRVVAQGTLCKPTYPYKGLKGYWTIDDYNSTGVSDVSGNNNFGTFEGTAFGTDNITGGQVGKALEFDGSDDYVEVPDSTSLDMAKAITVSIFIKTDTLQHNSGVITKGGTGPTSGWSLAVHDSAGNKVRFRVWLDGTAYQLGVEVDYWDNQWHHIVATSKSGEQKLYFDGGEVRSTTGTGSIDTNNYDVEIGHLPSHAYFDGTIDEPRIYDRALSKNEIKELYEAENHSARRRIDVTVRNIGSEEIPKATWVANLKQDGTTVETDAYNASSIGTGELKTLKFYFKDFKPNTEYTVELQGTGTSTTVSC